MYLVPVEIKDSAIHGRGVFAKVKITKGSVVWKYKKGHDHKMDVATFDALEHKKKKALERIAYLSPQSDMWVFPPEEDPACYTNHSQDPNMEVLIDAKRSEEPIFIAKHDIEVGEELTNSYDEFDENASSSMDWLDS